MVASAFERASPASAPPCRWRRFDRGRWLCGRAPSAFNNFSASSVRFAAFGLPIFSSVFIFLLFVFVRFTTRSGVAQFMEVTLALVLTHGPRIRPEALMAKVALGIHWFKPLSRLYVALCPKSGL